MFIKHNKFSVLVAFCFIFARAVAFNPNIFANELNLNLLNLKAHTNDPQHAANCINHYNPMIIANLDEFQTELNKCSDTATAQRKEIDAQDLQILQTLASRTEDSCKALKECLNLTDIISQYICYANQGNAAAQTMRDVSTDAKSDGDVRQNNIHGVDGEENVCRNTAERDYEQKYIEVYTALADCINGKTDVPTSKPTTTSTTVKASSSSSSESENSSEENY